MQFEHVLVICAGNICRSPMAEYLFKQALPTHQVESAGIVGMVGHPADPLSIECMQEIGVDITPHIAKKLTNEELSRADIVFTMSRDQTQHLEQQWPFIKGRVYRLGHWGKFDIPDPYKHPKADFIHARDLIIQGVNEWKNKL